MMEPDNTPEFVELKYPEDYRTYVFPHGEITFYNIARIAVSKSGTHRLETNDGKKHIVPTGWIGITFDAADWTF